MRRKDREVTDVNEIVEIIANCEISIVGMRDEEDIYMVPLNFGHTYQDDQLTLYFHCAHEGKKIDLLKRNPRVSFEMDCGHVLTPSGNSYTYKYGCVLGKGIVEFIEDSQLKSEAMEIILQHYDINNLTVTTEMLAATTMFKIIVTEFTGKRNK
jgi:Predicted flavin-nucleotide-binding protein